MKPAAFKYLCPRSEAEMLDMLCVHGGDGKVLAGGQSLVPAMNFRLARPAVLIDANEIGELDFIAGDDGFVRIGALVRHAAFHAPVVEGPLGGLLSRVVRHIAHYPIRQRGTFGGSLAHADPAAEWCLVATTLRAQVLVRSKAGQRLIEAGDFFRGTFTTDLKPDELIVEVRLPALGPDWVAGFCEFSRRAGDFALAMALVAMRLEDGRIAEARIGIGAVSDRALRLEKLEAQLVGHSPSARLCEEIGAAAREGIAASADIHASADYRLELLGAMVTRAMAGASA